MWFDAVYRKRIASGVALLKVDEDATMFRDRSGPWNFALLDSLVPPWRHHLIVKARFNDKPIDPRDLNGLRVFYRFYCDDDRFGKRRPYLWLAARSRQATYAGTRLVVISRELAFLVPDKTARTDIAAYLKMKQDRAAGIGYHDLIEPPDSPAGLTGLEPEFLDLTEPTPGV